MYKDVQNSNNVDKQMLNQLVNENVILFSLPRNSKTPEKSNFLAFFFVLILDEQLDDMWRVGFSL